MRSDYLMATLNPDDPGLDVYKQYINCSRPLPEWESETPKEIKDELQEEPKPGWVHWFFSFAHNLGPVSYTHLDVYKRQGPDGAGLDRKTAVLLHQTYDGAGSI